METINVPFEFGVLFIIPVGVFIYMMHQYYSFAMCMSVYMILQVSLAILARIIYMPVY